MAIFILGHRNEAISIDCWITLIAHWKSCATASKVTSLKIPIGATLKRADALAVVTKSKPALVQQFGVTRLATFGYTARALARTESDIDILVGCDGPATSARYFGVQFCLEDLFGCPINLVTEKAVRAELRPYIEKEAVHV